MNGGWAHRRGVSLPMCAVVAVLVAMAGLTVWLVADNAAPTARQWCTSHGGHPVRYGGFGDFLCYTDDGRMMWPDEEVRR